MPCPVNTQNQRVQTQFLLLKNSTYAILDKTWKLSVLFCWYHPHCWTTKSTFYIWEIIEFLTYYWETKSELSVYLSLLGQNYLSAKKVWHPKLSEHRIACTLEPQKISLIAYSKETWIQLESFYKFQRSM